MGTSGNKGLRSPDHVLILTCDQEVGEDQEAAAAEAHRTVGGSQRGQEEETAGQFTNTQNRRSFQYTIHGCNTTHTCGFNISKNWFSFFASGWRSSGMSGTLLTLKPPTMLNISLNFYTLTLRDRPAVRECF